MRRLPLLLTLSGCLLPLEATNPLDVNNPETKGILPGFTLRWYDAEVHLEWDLVELDDVAGYNVYRRVGEDGSLEFEETTGYPPWQDYTPGRTGLNRMGYAMTVLGGSDSESLRTEERSVTTLIDPLDDTDVGDWEGGSFNEGEMVVSSATGTANWAASTRIEWSTFLFEARIDGFVAEDGGDRAIMLFFRGQSADFDDCYVASLLEDGTVQLSRRTEGEWITLDSVETGSSPFDSNTFGVVAANENLGVLLNGAMILQTEDSSYPSGYVGVGAQNGMHARVKSISVFSPQ